MTNALITQYIEGGIIVILALERLFNGSFKVSKEIGAAYKERADQLQESFKELNEKFIVQGKEISALQATVKSKDEHIDALNQTILNRNPELEKILNQISLFLGKLSEETKYQTVILEKGQERNKKIDEATIQEEGHILRKK